MNQSAISDIVRKQRDFFNSGKTKDISFRIQQLKIFKKAIIENEEAILKAAKFDNNKPASEAYVSEIGIALNEIHYAIKNLKSWAKPKKVNHKWCQVLTFDISILISPNIPYRP